MPQCHNPALDARRPFATAPYRPEASGRLEPRVLPTLCIHAEAGNAPCRIGFNHSRDRKTGPAFAVAVLKCHTHGRCFTLYPLGHYPFGRAAVAPVGSDGEPLRSAGGDEDGRLAWGLTLFAAVFALASGDKPRRAHPMAWWATEPADTVAFAAAVLGLGLGLSERRGEAIAESLGIARLELRQADRDYGAARGPAARAAVVVVVLGRLPKDRCLLDSILGSGALAGCWAPAARWDPGERTARRRLFPGRGIPDG